MGPAGEKAAAERKGKWMGWYFDPLYDSHSGDCFVFLQAQTQVTGTFRHYSQIAAASGLTGADVARQLLAANHIHDVRVEAVAGSLSDHYDPENRWCGCRNRSIAKTSLAALSVASEVGHAIQHENDYVPLRIRSALAPVASLAATAPGFC